MKYSLKNNYDDLKKEMRKLLKSECTQQEMEYINSQILALTDTIKDINQKTFDIDVKEQIDNMYKTFTPYMISYWLLNNTDI